MYEMLTHMLTNRQSREAFFSFSTQARQSLTTNAIASSHMLDDMHSPRTLVTVSSEDTSSTLVARVRRVKPPSRVTVCHERVREACARSSESDA
jgi:hypothetical protein